MLYKDTIIDWSYYIVLIIINIVEFENTNQSIYLFKDFKERF